MDGSSPPDLQGELTAVLDWWRQAGVDCRFDDAPREWITAAATIEPATPDDPDSFPALRKAPAPATPPPPRAMIGGDRAQWPASLAEFADWWLSEPSLDFGRLRGRVPPRGPQGAPLMVMVCEPEAGDSDRLLSGAQGKLLAAMLAAMAVPAEQVYVASALPRHTPMPDWAELGAAGLGEVLRHHLALVRPQRLISFGRHVAPLLMPPGLGSALAGNDPTQTTPILPVISHDAGSVSLLVARDLGSLLERPIAKGNFWQHWLEWSAG